MPRKMMKCSKETIILVLKAETSGFYTPDLNDVTMKIKIQLISTKMEKNRPKSVSRWS